MTWNNDLEEEEIRERKHRLRQDQLERALASKANWVATEINSFLREEEVNDVIIARPQGSSIQLSGTGCILCLNSQNPNEIQISGKYMFNPPGKPWVPTNEWRSLLELNKGPLLTAIKNERVRRGQRDVEKLAAERRLEKERQEARLEHAEIRRHIWSKRLIWGPFVGAFVFLYVSLLWPLSKWVFGGIGVVQSDWPEFFGWIAGILGIGWVIIAFVIPITVIWTLWESGVEYDNRGLGD